MAYQSEAELEMQFIEQLNKQGYTSVQIDIREAVNQIMGRYKKHSFTGLYHYTQLFVVSNGVDTKYFANSDRGWMHSLAFFWTDFNNVRITNLKDFSLSFLARDHIIKMFTRYMILNDADKNLMVMRPYQVYAVEALVRQAALTNRNAYIWHTTGAGKTLTSFKTAQILAAGSNIKKVIFLVDRKDLDSQTTEEFNKFEAGAVDTTDRTDILVKQMQDKNRQLIVTTIQKMSNAVRRPQYMDIMNIYKDEKVVLIVDECHRSQFGDMHKDIVRHFQRAQFFGFTGTPRFEVNGKTEGKITQTTDMLFGECLHNYLIKDAIFDNNVLGFHIEYMNTLKGDFDRADPTVADAIDVGELYLHDERMSLIANHIVRNHKSKTRNGQYTAIFAVSSIEALIKYYDIFGKIKHDLNISGIFSFGKNEESEGKDEHSRDALERIIRNYNEMYNTNFSTDTFSAYHKAGEFYTPSGPAELLCRLACLGLTDVKDAADPTCGSGSLLLRLKNYANVRNYYGQELTSTTYNLARMNMILRGVPYRNFNIYNGNTLEHDYFGEMKFRVQVANPPYSANWSADAKFMEDERFNEYGKLAPKSKADFAFVQHMVYHMDEDGRAVVLLPHGVLFRGAAEEVIRKYLIQKMNVLDAVIGLPANLFFGTGIPVCVLVLKRERNGNSDNILFIDASKEFEAGKNQNILRESDIDKIASAYEARMDVDKFAHVATMKEVEENGFNLNIPRYVDTFEPEEEIDLNEVAAEIRKLQSEIKTIDAQLKPYFDELGLDFPFEVEGR